MNWLCNPVSGWALRTQFGNRVLPMEEPSKRLHRALNGAIEQLLRPLCRLLLRHGVSSNAFERIAKRVYVEVAYKELGAGGKSPTASRIAVTTGLTRKDVRHVLAELGSEEGDRAPDSNRANKVLAAWGQDADFCDSNGSRLPLDTDAGPAFAELVRRYSGDMPSKAVLDELIRLDAVQRLSDGSLRPVEKRPLPSGYRDLHIEALGRHVAALIETVDHNIQHGATDPRFQRKVMYVAFPASAVPSFRMLCAQEVELLLNKVDRWAIERGSNEWENSPGHVNAGFGIYYFEERLGRRS
jgi:hypothetical protein